MTSCINLRKLFGDRFKITYEESYREEHGDRGRADDPWLQQIPCQHGHICPWGEDLLAACSDKSGSTAKKLRELPFLIKHLSQDGSDGINAVFDVQHFDEVAAIMKPRKRRTLSASHVKSFVEAGRQFWFSSGSNVKGFGLELPPRDRKAS